jgi:hypothetical protein
MQSQNLTRISLRRLALLSGTLRDSSLILNQFLLTYASTKSALGTPHTGQHQSSGKSSKFVPGAIPLSGSPSAGS